MTANPSFDLGVTYWPRPKANTEHIPFSWHNNDRGAVRHDVAHIADLGCTTLRLELRWEEFQPGPAQIGSDAMRTLEQVLDAAHAGGLRTTLALCGGTLAGALSLPRWATGFRPDLESALATHFGQPLVVVAPDQLPILSGRTYQHQPACDLYGDAEQTEAQRYLLREVIGYFVSHPAIAQWQLAPLVERSRTARASEAAFEWWAALVEHARDQGTQQIVGTIDAYSLARRDTIRPGQLAEFGVAVAVSSLFAEPLQALAPWRGEVGRFLHALTATLIRENGASVPLIVDVGLATLLPGREGWASDEVYGRPTRTYFATEEQQAAVVGDALQQAYRAGAAGVWLAAYADPPQGAWVVPPLDRTLRSRSVGLVANGAEKPAAQAVREFAQQLQQGALGEPGTPPVVALDYEQYWRNPAQQLRALWAEWQR